MAKGKSPIFSEIRKAFKIMDIRTRRNKVIELAKYRWPTNPNTQAQQQVRQKYGQLVEQWRALTQAQKEEYNERAKSLKISGWNLFIKENLVVPVVEVVGMDLIAEITTDTNVSELVASNLDINTHKLYFVFVIMKNADPSSSTDINIYINGDETDTNYTTQYHYAYGSYDYMSTSNYPFSMNPDAGYAGFMKFVVMLDPDGYPRILGEMGYYAGGYFVVKKSYTEHSTTQTNITEIKAKSSVANAISAGSKMLVFGYKA